MAKEKKVPEVETPTLPQSTTADDLLKALVQAIQLTKPVEKKNAVNRKPGSPWDPKDGSKKLKLKRKMYQHGLLIDPEIVSNEEIDLLNRVKVGRFFNGLIKIYRRKDHGIDIDYPVKTAAQRMRIGTLAGVRGLANILEHCIEEAANPKVETSADED